MDISGPLALFSWRVFRPLRSGCIRRRLEWYDDVVPRDWRRDCCYSFKIRHIKRSTHTHTHTHTPYIHHFVSDGCRMQKGQSYKKYGGVCCCGLCIIHILRTPPSLNGLNKLHLHTGSISEGGVYKMCIRRCVWLQWSLSSLKKKGLLNTFT